MYEHHTQPIHLKKEALKRRFHIQSLLDKYFENPKIKLQAEK